MAGYNGGFASLFFHDWGWTSWQEPVFELIALAILFFLWWYFFDFKWPDMRM